MHRRRRDHFADELEAGSRPTPAPPIAPRSSRSQSSTAYPGASSDEQAGTAPTTSATAAIGTAARRHRCAGCRMVARTYRNRRRTNVRPDGRARTSCAAIGNRRCRVGSRRALESLVGAVATGRMLRIGTNCLPGDPAEDPRPTAARGRGRHHHPRARSARSELLGERSADPLGDPDRGGHRGDDDVPPDPIVRLAGERDADGQRRRADPPRSGDASGRPVEHPRVVRLRGRCRVLAR